MTEVDISCVASAKNQILSLRYKAFAIAAPIVLETAFLPQKCPIKFFSSLLISYCTNYSSRVQSGTALDIPFSKFIHFIA